MRRAVTAAALALSVLALAGNGPVSAGTGTELLPDLVVRRASELDIRVTPSGRHRLRFTTTTANLGAGVVELAPEQGDCDQDGDLENDRTAIQRSYLDQDGNGVFDRSDDTQFLERTVGCFVFHAIHDHWHFEDFARYRLVNPRTGRAVATQAKVGFCVVDSYRWRAELPGSPANAYYRSCQPDAVQGLSVGWTDVYQAFLAAQWLDVSGLPPGRYCLVQRIDPSSRIAEADEANNLSRTPLRLRDDSAFRRRGSC
jgi:hypothetical protein